MIFIVGFICGEVFGIAVHWENSDGRRWYRRKQRQILQEIPSLGFRHSPSELSPPLPVITTIYYNGAESYHIIIR
jgi:hypothetical protein